MKRIKYLVIISAIAIVFAFYLSSAQKTGELRKRALAYCIDNIPHRDLSSYKPVVGLSFNSDFMIDSLFHYFEVEGNQYSIAASVHPKVLAGTPIDSINYRNLSIYYSSNYEQMLSFIVYVYCTTNKDVDVEKLIKTITNLSPGEFWDMYWGCMRIEAHKPSTTEKLCNHVLYLLPTEENTCIDAIRLNQIGAITNIYLNNYINIQLKSGKGDDLSGLIKKTFPEPDFFDRMNYEPWLKILDYNDSTIINKQFDKARQTIRNTKFIVAAVDDFYLGYTGWNTKSLEDNAAEKKNYLIALSAMMAILVSFIAFDVNRFNEQKKQIRILEEKQNKCFSLKSLYPNAYGTLCAKTPTTEQECDSILKHDETWFSQRETEIIEERERKLREEEAALALARKQEEEAKSIREGCPEGYEAWYKEIISTRCDALLEKVNSEFEPLAIYLTSPKYIDPIDLMDLPEYDKARQLKRVKQLLEKRDVENTYKELMPLLRFPDSKVIEYKERIQELGRKVLKDRFNKQWFQKQGIFTVTDCSGSITDNLYCDAGSIQIRPNFQKTIYILHLDAISLNLPVACFGKYFFCPDEDLDYRNLPKQEELRKIVPLVKKGTKRLDISSSSDSISRFIEQIAKSYCNTPDDYILVLLNTKKQGWDEKIIYNHLKEISSLVKDPYAGKIRFFDMDSLLKKGLEEESHKGPIFQKVVIVVDLIASVEEQLQSCKSIIGNEGNRITLITCISIVQELKRDQMQKLIEDENKKVEEQIRAKKLEESAQKNLVNNAYKWHNRIDSIPYAYLVNYYPTTCDFEANQKEWDDRNLIWDFKNDPDKIHPDDNKAAIKKIIPMIKDKLFETFGEHDLQYLTLVCIPASTSRKNELRYKKFSNKLCKATGMINSFSQIKREIDIEAKHENLDGLPTNILEGLIFDERFFKGKYVLLFDDIITKGNNMLIMASKLTSLGATIVGCLALGKTKHTREY